MRSFHVILQTPTTRLFDGVCQGVRLKTDLGRIEVLDQHATLVGVTRYSKVYLREEHKEEGFVIRQGTITVDASGTVHILALFADKLAEMTVENMTDYLHYLKETLENPEALNAYQLQFLERQREALEEGLQEAKERV